MGLTDRRRHLLDTARWKPLRAFIERWYARSLADDDGHTPLEIELAATRLGNALPPALGEWFELVGRRLRDVQDSPERLDQLKVDAGIVSLWAENQGNWFIVTMLDDGDDPHCLVDDGGANYASPDAPLSRTLLGMVVSDTLVGSWGMGTRFGSLGELAPTVRGGYCHEFSDEQVQRLRSAYEPLDYPRNPLFKEPYRGNEATIIRIHDVSIEWMTATDEAFAVLDGVFGLTPPGGEHEVLAAFKSLSPKQREHVLGVHAPYAKLLGTAVAGVGQLLSVSCGEPLVFSIRTREPQQVLALILAALPSDFLPHLTVTTRPVAISEVDVLYPDLPP